MIATGQGNTATFSNLTSPRALTLGANRTIGNITLSGSGNVTISGNTLNLDVASGSSTINVGTSRSLALSSTITGNDEILKTGAGTFSFVGTVNHTGQLRIQEGVVLGSNLSSSLGSIAGVTLDGGRLRFSNTGANLTNRTFTKAITITENGGSISKGGAEANPHIYSGTFTSSGTGNRTVTLTGENGTVARISSILGDPTVGALSLRKETGGGTWLLNAANTFSGSTSIVGGLLVLENANALQNSYIDTAASATGNATNGLRTTGAALNLGGLTGNKHLAAIYTTATGGYDSVTTLTLNTVSGADLTYSGNLSANTDGTGTKAAALVKTGNGKQTLSGISRYTGTTTVSGGTLVVNGQLANTSSVTVGGTGATLQGSGTINSSVTINSGGTLASGNSIESLEITGDLTQATGSTFAYEMDRSETDANLAGDLTVVGGDFNLAAAAGSTLTLTELGLTDSWSGGDKLTLIAYTGAWNNNLFTYLGTPLADDSTFSFSGIDWTFNYNDTLPGDNYTADLNGGLEKYVTMTAIPEPGATLLGGLGVLLLLRRRR